MPKPSTRPFLIFLFATVVYSAHGFALLGPFTPWMVSPLAYYAPGAIGGPMKMGQGYRWNVPLITYGFDSSFLDYFGTNGTTAVTGALQILNDLDRASRIDLANFNSHTISYNYQAENQDLLDLKSAALTMLLEQMGLGESSACVYCLTSFSYDPGSFQANYSIETRNFDPAAFTPSEFINDDFFSGLTISLRIGNQYILYNGIDGGATPHSSPTGFGFQKDSQAFAYAYSSDSFLSSAVSDLNLGVQFYNNGLQAGMFLSGLTRDDVGGLVYQLNTNNIALESLLPGITGFGTNAANYVDRALRPGLDKITFQEMVLTSTNPQAFLAVTNQYIDSFLSNGILHQQNLQRIIHQPDILFTAKYIGLNIVSRTGTTNWINNGGTNEGPGIIQPQVMINFNRFGPSLESHSQSYPSSSSLLTGLLPTWGSFDGTTNFPIVYPTGITGSNSTEFHFLLFDQTGYESQPKDFIWNCLKQPHALFLLQTSTDLSNWITIATLTNVGGTFTYVDYIYLGTPQRFFRTLDQ